MKISLDLSSLKSVSILFVILLYSSVLNNQFTNAARILALFATPAQSHIVMFKSLMRALAERGHYVEVVSPYLSSGEKPKNYTEIVLPIPHVDREVITNALINRNYSPFKEHAGLFLNAGKVCETQLASAELQRYLSPDAPKFDLVIVELFFFDCMVGFSHRFDAPLIAMVSQFAIPWAFDLVGCPKSYSYVPLFVFPYGQKMSFAERLHNTLYSIGTSLFRRYVSMPIQNNIAKQYFGLDSPPLWEIEEKVSLILSNGHPAFSPIHPTMPNLVDVAGMHILAKPPLLPKDLEEIMERNKKVILFSLGSIIEGSDIEDERVIVILNALKQVPCKVLWKWNVDVKKLPMNLPSNVQIFKWLPQQSLLAHPNLVGFVTHGGLLSLQESTYHGVPIIGFPFFGDQSTNLRRASDVGFCITLNFFTFSSEELVHAINKIISDPFYRENAKRMSSIFRDQPQTPLERGVYWTEYVIRHKGAPHLISGAKDLMWFQYYLIDVILFLLLSSITVIVLLYYAAVLFKSCVCGTNKKPKKD